MPRRALDDPGDHQPRVPGIYALRVLGLAFRSHRGRRRNLGRDHRSGRGGELGRRLRPGTSTLLVTGDGFQASTPVKFYRLPSTYLGQLMNDASGTFKGNIPIPPGIAPGQYTLQMNGFAPSGAIKSLSIGVIVKSTAAATAKKSRRCTSRRCGRSSSPPGSRGCSPWPRWSIESASPLTKGPSAQRCRGESSLSLISTGSRPVSNPNDVNRDHMIVDSIDDSILAASC